MSRGLGKTQKHILTKVADLGQLSVWHALVSVKYSKPSLSRAIKSLERSGYIARIKSHENNGGIGEAADDVLKPTSKGLQYWADNIADGDI